jgi:hypothetical protein
MKNFYKIPRAQLAVEAVAAANAFASGKVSSLSPVQSAELAAAILAEAELLKADDVDAVTKKAESIAATERAEQRQRRLAKMMSGAKLSMRGVDASAAEFDAVGFTPPAETRSMVTPETPTGVSAYGVNGGVKLEWVGQNYSGSVFYQIYERNYPAGPWALLGSTTKQKFIHKGVPPGQFHQYEVKAQASDGTFSARSNTAAVYTNSPSVA